MKFLGDLTWIPDPRSSWEQVSRGWQLVL